MSKLSEVIKTLQTLEREHGGDCPVNVYLSYSKEDKEVNIDEISFDDVEGDVYFGIYA